MSTTKLTIDALGPKGDGIHFGRHEPAYVERAIPGDLVAVRIERDDHGVARGEVVELIESSPYRIAAPCAHYENCGGCTLQHLDSGFYREWKVQVVKEAFHKQGLLPRQWLKPIFLGAKNRRRATFATFRSRGKLVMGYYRRRSRQITEIDSCLIASPELLALRDEVRPFLSRILPSGKIADVFLQRVEHAADMVITGPIGRHGQPDAEVKAVVAELLAASQVKRVSWRPSEADAVVSLGNQGPIVASFGELRVNLPPAAFLQPTPEGEAVLVEAVMNALPAQGIFADLFSGCGTFSGPMISRGAVDSYESVPSAVSALAKAAGKQSLKVYRRDLFRHPLRRDEINRYDAVVFDPPRSGCAEQAASMATAKTGVLVGVSCNPATFARDARLLCDGGYWLQSLQVVDQFVWSHHVEVVGVFTKKKRQSGKR